MKKRNLKTKISVASLTAVMLVGLVTPSLGWAGHGNHGMEEFMELLRSFQSQSKIPTQVPPGAFSLRNAHAVPAYNSFHDYVRDLNCSNWQTYSTSYVCDQLSRLYEGRIRVINPSTADTSCNSTTVSINQIIQSIDTWRRGCILEHEAARNRGAMGATAASGSVNAGTSTDRIIDELRLQINELHRRHSRHDGDLNEIKEAVLALGNRLEHALAARDRQQRRQEQEDDDVQNTSATAISAARDHAVLAQYLSLATTIQRDLAQGKSQQAEREAQHNAAFEKLNERLGAYAHELRQHQDRLERHAQVLHERHEAHQRTLEILSSKMESLIAKMEQLNAAHEQANHDEGDAHAAARRKPNRHGQRHHGGDHHHHSGDSSGSDSDGGSGAAGQISAEQMRLLQQMIQTEMSEIQRQIAQLNPTQAQHHLDAGLRRIFELAERIERQSSEGVEGISRSFVDHLKRDREDIVRHLAESHEKLDKFLHEQAQRDKAQMREQEARDAVQAERDGHLHRRLDILAQEMKSVSQQVAAFTQSHEKSAKTSGLRRNRRRNSRNSRAASAAHHLGNNNDDHNNDDHSSDDDNSADSSDDSAPPRHASTRRANVRRSLPRELQARILRISQQLSDIKAAQAAGTNANFDQALERFSAALVEIHRTTLSSHADSQREVRQFMEEYVHARDEKFDLLAREMHRLTEEVQAMREHSASSGNHNAAAASARDEQHREDLLQRIEAIMRRLGSLDAQVAAHNTGFREAFGDFKAQFSMEISSLLRQRDASVEDAVRKMTEFSERYERVLHETRGALHETRDAIARHGNTVERLEREVHELTGGIATLRQQILQAREERPQGNAADHRAGGLDDHAIAQLRAQFEHLTQRVLGFQDVINDQRRAFGETNSALLAQYGGALDLLRDLATKNSDVFREVDAHVAQRLAEYQAEIQRQIGNALADQDARHNAHARALEEQIVGLTRNIGELAKRIDAAHQRNQEAGSASSNSHATQENEIASLRAEFLKLSDQVLGFQRTVDANREDYREHAQRLHQMHEGALRTLQETAARNGELLSKGANDLVAQQLAAHRQALALQLQQHQTAIEGQVRDALSTQEQRHRDAVEETRRVQEQHAAEMAALTAKIADLAHGFEQFTQRGSDAGSATQVALQQELGRVTAQIAAFQKVITANEDVLDHMNEQLLRSYRDMVDRLQKAADNSEALVERANAGVRHEFAQHMQQLLEQLKSHQMGIDRQLEDMQRAHRQELNALSGQIERLNDRLSRPNQEIAGLRGEVEGVLVQLRRVPTEEILEARLAENFSRFQRTLMERLDERDSANAHLRNELVLLNQRYDAAVRANNDQLNRLTDEMAQFNRAVRELHAQHGQHAGNQSRLAADLARLEHEISDQLRGLPASLAAAVDTRFTAELRQLNANLGDVETRLGARFTGLDTTLQAGLRHQADVLDRQLTALRQELQVDRDHRRHEIDFLHRMNLAEHEFSRRQHEQNRDEILRAVRQGHDNADENHIAVMRRLDRDREELRNELQLQRAEQQRQAQHLVDLQQQIARQAAARPALTPANLLGGPGAGLHGNHGGGPFGGPGGNNHFHFQGGHGGNHGRPGAPCNNNYYYGPLGGGGANGAAQLPGGLVQNLGPVLNQAVAFVPAPLPAARVKPAPRAKKSPGRARDDDDDDDRRFRRGFGFGGGFAGFGGFGFMPNPMMVMMAQQQMLAQQMMYRNMFFAQQQQMMMAAQMAPMMMSSPYVGMGMGPGMGPGMGMMGGFGMGGFGGFGAGGFGGFGGMMMGPSAAVMPMMGH